MYQQLLEAIRAEWELLGAAEGDVSLFFADPDEEHAAMIAESLPSIEYINHKMVEIGKLLLHARELLTDQQFEGLLCQIGLPENGYHLSLMKYALEDAAKEGE